MSELTQVNSVAGCDTEVMMAGSYHLSQLQRFTLGCNTRRATTSSGTLVKIAAGEFLGSLEIKVSDVSQFSSFLEQTDVAQRLFDTSYPSATESVEMTTLDQFTSGLRGNIFLKVDTQGYEEAVLKGSQQLLQRVCGVQLELPIIHLYRGTWKLTRAVEYMEERGFIISQLAPVSFAPGDSTCLVEVDATFRRFDKSIDGGD
jgi:FkbM family methyltransferase